MQDGLVGRRGGGVGGLDGEGGRWRASEHAPLRLDRCHFSAPPCPQPAAVRTRWLPSHTKTGHTHTGTHCGTHSHLGFEQEKRFPERFLKVELLKAQKPVSALKLNGLPLCYVWHQAEWRQCFKWPTKVDLKPLVFLDIDTLTALRYRLHCVAALSVAV